MCPGWTTIAPRATKAIASWNSSIPGTQVTLAAGSTYTRQSYIKDIIHKNRRGDVIEKYHFELADKDASEYRTSDFEPGMGQSVYLNQAARPDRPLCGKQRQR